MEFLNPGDKRVVAVLGASDKPERVSNRLFFRLLGRPEYEVIPVHPKLKELGGTPVAPSLSAIPQPPDVLTLYVGAQISRGLEREILALKPGKVIFNPGAENPELQETLERNGISTENACSLVLLSQNAL